MAVGLQGLEDESKYPSLVIEVQSQGIKRDDILGIMGLNVVKVLEDIEAVATSMAGDKIPKNHAKPFLAVNQTFRHFYLDV